MVYWMGRAVLWEPERRRLHKNTPLVSHTPVPAFQNGQETVESGLPPPLPADFA